MPDSISRWFVCPKSEPEAKLRLFCFPFAGGGASFYRNWKYELSPGIEQYAIQIPGRESRLRENPYTELISLVEKISDIIKPLLDLPFAFYGHSMGAWIAFELARRLRIQGFDNLIHLFASGRNSPHVPNSDPRLHDLPKSNLIEELRRYDGTPEFILREPELLDIFLPVLRADLKMLFTYEFRGDDLLYCPVSVYGGEEDGKTNLDSLMAWKQLTCRQFKLKMYPGGHFFIKDFKSHLLSEINIELKPHSEDFLNVN